MTSLPAIILAIFKSSIISPLSIAIISGAIISILSVAVVNGESVYFKDDKKLIKCPKGYIGTEEIQGNALWITHNASRKINSEENNVVNYLDEYQDRTVLKLIRKDIILGIGCRRDTDSMKLFNFINETLREKKLLFSAQEMLNISFLVAKLS